MKAQLKKLPKCQVDIEVEISGEEFDETIKETVSSLGKELEVEGFRKGKVPKEIIEKKIGQEKILKAAAEKAVRENYVRAVLENKLEVIGYPEIEILKMAKGNPFVFRAKATVLPIIQVPDCKKIITTLQKREVSVEEKEIDSALKWLQRSRAKFSQISQPAEKGNFVEIEFESPQIEEGKVQKDGFLLDQGHLIPGFEEKIEGMKQGEEKKFTIDFPEQHFKNDLAGKKADFKVKMISVQNMELPEINDEWAKTLGDFQELESLKKSIKEGLTAEKKNQEKERLRTEILEKITANISWEIPEILIESEKKRILENVKTEVPQRLGMKFEDYLQKMNKSEEEFLNSFQAEAEKRVKNFLILKSISENENIQVSEDEIKNELNKFLNNYTSVEETKKELDLEKLKEYHKEAIRNEKALQFLESFLK